VREIGDLLYKIFYECGMGYMERAEAFFSGNNFAAANTYAIYATQELAKARDCCFEEDDC
jgi:hypothetical protein